MLNTVDDIQIVLASGSPRRRELLDQIGVRYRVEVADIDETPLPEECPRKYVQRLALAKACAVAKRHGSLPVLGADTSVVLDDRILAKPMDRADGMVMLAALSGRSHTVLTAVALKSATVETVRLSISRVVFRPLLAEEIERYWATGEPVDKAGAYAIQGKAAAFIERVEGSYSGVMGLPLFETAELLQTVSISAI